MAQWLGLCAFTAEDLGSIPGLGTKIPQALRRGQEKKKSYSKADFFLERKKCVFKGKWLNQNLGEV